MGLLDDYVDEMDALSPEEVDAAVSGRVREEPAAARAATLVADLRRALVAEPAPEVARRHLEAMVAAAGGGVGARRLDMPVLTNRRKRGIGGLALAATLVLGTGLAAAVTPPGQPPATLPDHAADEAREAVGQGSEVSDEASAHGQAVSEVAQDATLEGCQKGLAVAAVASSKAGQSAPELPDAPCGGLDEDEDGPGGDDGGDARGEEASAFGKATAEQAKAEGRGVGQDTAADASEGQAELGQETADQASGGGNGGGSGGVGQASAAESISGEASGDASSVGGPPSGTPGGPPGA
jgi:hypothetical protein